MKLPLIAACLVAGSTWSFAFADATSATNQKTAPRPYSASQTGSSLRTQSTPAKQTPAALRQAGSQQKQADAQKEQRYPQTPAEQAQSEKIRAEQAAAEAATARKLAQAPQTSISQKQALQQQMTQQLKRALHLQPGPVVPHSMLVAAPVNDDCSAAIGISGSGPFATDTTGATTSVQQSGICTNSTLDIWYQWTAGATGNCTMEMCGGPSYDSVIAAYTGAGCPVGTALACNDDGCAPLSTITFPVTSGNVYMLQVGGWSGNFGPGSFTMNVVTPPPPPVNDDCTSPTVVVGTGSFPYDNVLATAGVDGQNETICLAYGSMAIAHDVWYQWVAPFSGVAQFDTCGSFNDTKIAAYPGAGCPTLNSSLACNDDSAFCGGLMSQVQFPVTAGNTYTLQLGMYPFAAGSVGNFNLSQVLILPLDDCSLPQVISGNGSFPFDNTTMTTSPQQATCGGGATNDLWFQWTATATGNAQMDTCGATFDTVIAAYDGAGCPVNPALACNDDGSCPLQSSLVFSAVAGNTYMLQVGGFFGATGTGNMNINVVPPLPLDDCSLPQVIAGIGSFPFDTTTMTTGPQQAFCGTAELDEWFQWVSPTTGVLVADTCGSSFDTILAVYDGAGCPINPALTCNDQGVCGGVFTNQSVCTAAVTAGNTYTLQVGGWFGAFGPGTLNLNVLTPPANDDCSAAAPIVGLGVFPYDNTACSTGVDGQTEALCMAFGNPAIQNDLWFSWTSPISGPVSADTCGLTALNTKIAVYAGTGCPVAGTALACGELNCGGQSRALFTATAGSTYTIQLGTWVFGSGGGAGSFELVNAAPPANDDCSAPTAISGTGSFPYDITFATTGVDGQAESLCSFYGSTAITTDAWFTWTAPATGCTIVDVCGSGLDGKMSVYPGSGCPTPGTSIACSDDDCGLAPQVRFQATAGSTYTIQLGTWPFGAVGNSGFLNVAQTVAGPGNDECSAATVVVGTGTFPYDNSAATTGCEGQVGICAAPATIFNDIWFQWTAPSTGFGVYSTCGGLSAEDTVLAVYSGAGCPTPGAPLACNDDACGVGSGSTVVWPVTAGQVFTLQHGDWGGTPGGVGLFSLDVLPPPGPCDALDDSTTENLWSTGVAAGTTNDNVWLVRFGEVATTTTIDSIDIMYGSAAFPGSSPPAGTATDIMLYADGVSQDGDPTDATLLATIPSTSSAVDTDTYVNVPLPTPITVSGYFFAGGHEAAGLGIWVAPNDTGSFWPGRSFIFGNNQSGLADLTTPSNNVFPPTGLEAMGGVGNFCVRVHCSFGPATYTCTPGDPGINLCPCSNPPTGSNRGCDNQQATGGASITGSGTASVSSSSLVFTTAGENASVGSVLIQGTAFNAGISFGHGVRCAAGAVKRLYIKIASGGSITAPGGLDPSIPVRSAALAAPILPGDTRYYQVYYRDTTVALPGCPVLANRFNVTNAAVVVWQP